jgi:UDP-2,3-diacylglucosamine hydrolase
VSGELVFVGDVHLDEGDDALAPFLDFLRALGGRAARVVLLGDVFNLWIGRRELERPHQTAVIEELARLRACGVAVRLVEGNREFRVGACYAGRAFDDASANGLEERFGGHRIRAVHGDLANPADRRYRAWRRVSRSAPFWALFQLVPRTRRLGLAAALERRMRSSNPGFKRAFPEREVREYADGFLRQGYDTVVLGHFHVERELGPAPGSPAGRVIVLPEWRASRRHLRVTPAGEIGFVAS